MQQIVFVLPSFAGGGAERVVIGLANGLNRDRYEPVMIVLENKGPLASDLDESIQVISLERPRLRQAVAPLRRILQEMRPSVVMSTMGYLNLGILWAARSERNKTAIVVREANDPEVTFAALPVPAIGRWLYKYYYRKAARIVVPSKIIGERLLNYCLVRPIIFACSTIRCTRPESRQAAAEPKRRPGQGDDLLPPDD